MAFHRNNLLEVKDIDEYFYFEDDNAVAECYSSDNSDLSEAEEESKYREVDIINRFLLEYNTPNYLHDDDGNHNDIHIDNDNNNHDHDSLAHSHRNPSRKVLTTSSACWPSHQPHPADHLMTIKFKQVNANDIHHTCSSYSLSYDY